jgi:hypothetical protein
MPAVPAAMPGPVVAAVLVTSAACHDEPTGFAELRSLRFHARGDLRYIRNDVGAQPHCIRCASLAGRIAALGGRTIDANDNDAGQ